MSEFKDMLAYYRKRDGLSQRELAQKIGVSASTIGMYETGKRFPEKEYEEALADLFNVSLNALRGVDEEKVPPMAKGAAELVNLYNQLNEEQRKAVIALLHSFVD